MKMGIIGGLMFGGLVSGALLGVGPGLALCGLGAVAGIIVAAQEHKAEKQAESWRRNYPSYKY